MRGEFDEISVHLKIYHCIHFVGLQARKWSRSETIWFLDSGAVENNKHQTLRFPISVGFKRTPYDTKSYCKPPGQTLFVYVGLTYKCFKHRLRKIATAKQADRVLARGIHRDPGAGPLVGVARGQRPLA